MMPFFLQALETREQYVLIEQLYNQYYSLMVSRAYQILNDISDAEDAAMKVFEKISEDPHLICDIEKTAVVAKLSLFTKNAAIDIYRKKKIRNNVLSYSTDHDLDILANVADPNQNIEDIAVNAENQTHLKMAIQNLDDKYRIPLLLKYYYNQSNSSIAKALNLTVENVNQRIFRAKGKLELILRGLEHK
ncbi:MAG: RNA polymerase sigma factor [Paludibacteraceae bacterium]|nr:RNA polymerase sigma factor [Paludibacteraceae bacterium]